jgi:hypothetical protein
MIKEIQSVYCENYEERLIPSVGTKLGAVNAAQDYVCPLTSKSLWKLRYDMEQPSWKSWKYIMKDLLNKANNRSTVATKVRPRNLQWSAESGVGVVGRCSTVYPSWSHEQCVTKSTVPILKLEQCLAWKTKPRQTGHNVKYIQRLGHMFAHLIQKIK